MSTITSKVVVVTGAGSGIGRELSAGLARRGARLALCDVNQAGLAETVEQSKALGAETYARTVDVSDLDAVQAFAAGVVEHYGVVHQIYNNAGIAGGGTTVLDTAYAEYQRIIDVNLWGVIHGTKEFLPHLIASGDGHVLRSVLIRLPRCSFQPRRKRLRTANTSSCRHAIRSTTPASPTVRASRLSLN